MRIPYLLTATLVALCPSTVHAAQPAPPPVALGTPRIISPINAQRLELAKSVIEITTDSALIIDAVSEGYDLGTKEDEASRKELDALSPGLADKVAAAGKAEMIKVVRASLPGFQAKMTRFYAENFTDDELSQMRTFFRSPTGAWYVRKLVTSTEGPELGDDLTVTTDDMLKVNEAAVTSTLKEMSREQKTELMRFGFSPAGRALQIAGTQIQAASAEWMTSILKETEARFTPVIEKVVMDALDNPGK